MFEVWVQEPEDSLLRIFDPPVPVVVDLGIAIPTYARAFRRDQISLRVKAGGLQIAGTVPGMLHAWVRATDGAWLGLVQCVVTAPNGRGRLTVQMLCSAKAVSRPAPSGYERRT